jgi:mRNA interferase MazF
LPRFAKRDLVLVPFPFSDEEGFKSRPAIVLASWPYYTSHDYMVCMVTTQSPDDPYMLELNTEDIEGGKLSETCYIRPTYLFSVDEGLIIRKLAAVRSEKFKSVLAVLNDLLTP